MLLTPPTVCTEHCKPCEAQVSQMVPLFRPGCLPISEHSEETLVWMPTCVSWLSLHAACRSHCGLTCTTSLVSSPLLFYSHHTHHSLTCLPLAQLISASEPLYMLHSKPRILFSSKIFKATPSLPAGVCSKPYLSWTPSLLILRKKA